MTDQDNITLEDVHEASRERSTMPPDTKRNLDVAHEVISNLLDAHLQAEREKLDLFLEEMKRRDVERDKQMSRLVERFEKALKSHAESLEKVMNGTLEAVQVSRENERDIDRLTLRVATLEAWREAFTVDKSV